MFFLCPESTYNRDQDYNIDQIANEDFEKLAAREHHLAADNVERTRSQAVIPPKRSWIQNLKPWSGVYTEDNLIKLVIAPFVTLLNIGALYTIVASGILVAWYVAVSFILAAWFSPPPYLFTAAQVGYLSAGPFIGGLLASVFMAFINDPIIRYCTRRNNGV